MMELNVYLKTIKKRLWLIVLCVLISTVTTGAYSILFYKPVYFAFTKLIINKTIAQGQDQLGNEQMDLGAIYINLGLISTYKEIIKTPAIMDKVVQRYPDLNMTVEKLNSIVSVSANGTQVITLEAHNYSYEKAAMIVNAVTEVVKTEIPRIMKVNNVEILNVADPDELPTPLSQQTSRKIIISFIISSIIAVSIVFLLEFLDDTLKTKKDVQLSFGLPVFSVIPTIKPKDMRSLKKKSARKQTGEASYATSER
jgi:capsular polysaccharide biosynthesis protein